MARLFLALLFAFALFAGAGCSGPTPYQKADKDGGLGYSDYKVKGNIYHIYFSGAPVKNQEVYRAYFHRRAKELCEGPGFQGYRVIEFKQDAGDPTPVEKPAVFYAREDPRNRSAETVKDFGSAATASGQVECMKQGK